MFKKAFIIYHKDDNDGVFSGALMYYYFNRIVGKQSCNIKTVGVDYNDLRSYDKAKLDELRAEYKYLVITDVSLPLELMEYAYNLWGKDFIWIDHHAPIIEAMTNAGLNKKVKGIRSIKESALYHAYQFCTEARGKNTATPYLLRILSALDSWHYDVFDKELCRAVNAGTTNEFKLDISAVIKLIEKNGLDDSASWDALLEQCKQIGNVLVEKSKRRDADLIARSGDYNWTITDKNGNPLRMACALFTQGPSSSLMFETADEERAQCGLIFKHNPDRTWTISLYNTREKFDQEFHAGQWCREKYQGGGHAGAAGCTISEEQFIEALKTRRI